MAATKVSNAEVEDMKIKEEPEDEESEEEEEEEGEDENNNEEQEDNFSWNYTKAATKMSNAEVEDRKIKEEEEEGEESSGDATKNLRLADQSDIKIENVGPDDECGEVSTPILSNEQEQEGEQTESNITHRCVICDERFECDTDFHKHRILHDRCPQCQELFLCHKELIIHLSLHAIEGNICLFCRKLSNTKETFDFHLNSHRHHFKTFECRTCGKKLLTSEEFKIHICNGKSEAAGKTTGGKPKQPKNGKRSNVTKASETEPNKKIKIEEEEEEDDDQDDGEESSGDATENLRLADRSDIKIKYVGSHDESGELGTHIPSKDDVDVQKVLMTPGGDISSDQIEDIKEENPDKPFKCGYCAIPYADGSQLYYHMAQVHPEKVTVEYLQYS